jgi:glycosyltransferase involved in cell wall biosynthesis
MRPVQANDTTPTTTLKFDALPPSVWRVRVCLDVQPAVAQAAGVGRYTRLLARHLGLAAADDSLVLFFFDFRRRGIAFAAPNASCRAVRWIPGSVVQQGWKRFGWPPFDAIAGPADVYHFPNFIRPPLRNGKSVVTIHDMSFMRLPQYTAARNHSFLSARIRDTAARSDAIITDSRFSAAEIAELLRVDPRRISAIYPGVAQTFAPPDVAARHAVLAALGLDRPYLLSVGTIEPRKNYAFLVEVFERLTDFDGDLVIAGRLGWKYEPLLRRIKDSSRRDRIRHIAQADDAHLPALYAGARAFVMPSFYEGFGFPPLEAMACGAPVVSSDGGSLKEVLDGAAVVLDSFDAERWAGEIRKVLSDSGHRQQLIATGLRHAARYNWTDTARRTWEVYRGLAG